MRGSKELGCKIILKQAGIVRIFLALSRTKIAKSRIFLALIKVDISVIKCSKMQLLIGFMMEGKNT